MCQVDKSNQHPGKLVTWTSQTSTGERPFISVYSAEWGGRVFGLAYMYIKCPEKVLQIAGILVGSLF